MSFYYPGLVPLNDIPIHKQHHNRQRNPSAPVVHAAGPSTNTGIPLGNNGHRRGSIQGGGRPLTVVTGGHGTSQNAHGAGTGNGHPHTHAFHLPRGKSPQASAPASTSEHSPNPQNLYIHTPHSAAPANSAHPTTYRTSSGHIQVAKQKGKKPVRGLVVPAVGYLKKDGREGREYAERFGRFEYEGDVGVEGYTLHAVDAWVTDRSKPIKAVISSSSSQADQVILHLLTPSTDLSEVEATREIEAAIKKMRRDGGRPVETEWGVMMVTSLSNLRQEVQSIAIPGGDYRHHRSDLYLKLNLKRLGSAGRSSLTLDPPSGATQWKFFSLYRIPGSGNMRTPFAVMVLELVRCLQVALGMCGMFAGMGEGHGREGGEEGFEGVVDGLVCDSTLRAVQRWRKEMDAGEDGELGHENGTGDEQGFDEEVLISHGPAIVAALLSTITSVRVKLAGLDVERVPRDPFTKTREFQTALLNFQRFQLVNRKNSITDHLSALLIRQITEAYNKEKHHDQTKLSRLLKNQVTQAGAGIASGIVTNLNISLGRDKDRGSDDETYDTADEWDGAAQASGASCSPETATINLGAFARLILSGKAGVGHGRLRALWTDRIIEQPIPSAARLMSMQDFAVDDGPPKDAGEEDLDIVDKVLTPDRENREREKERKHHRHRSTGKTGALRSMTSKTGHALKDWASRRGTLFGDSGDEASTAPASTTSFRHNSRQSSLAPVVILPDGDEGDTGSMTGATSVRSRMSGLPSERHSGSNSYRSGYAAQFLSDVESARPSFLTRPSATGSEGFGGYTDGTASEYDTALNSRRPSRHSTMEVDPRAKAKTAIMSAPFHPLDRMCSQRNVKQCMADSVEFWHDGHNRKAREQAHFKYLRERGIVRRWSFESLRKPGQLCDIPHRYLEIDVRACALHWELRTKQKQLEEKLEAFDILEDAVQRTFVSYVAEIKGRKAKIESLAEAATGLLSEPSLSNPGSQFSANRSDTDALRAASRLAAGKRLQKQLALKLDKLSYSSRELERTMEGVHHTKGVLDGFAAQYVANEPEPVDGEVDKPRANPPGWGTWLFSFWK